MKIGEKAHGERRKVGPERGWELLTARLNKLA